MFVQHSCSQVLEEAKQNKRVPSKEGLKKSKIKLPAEREWLHTHYSHVLNFSTATLIWAVALKIMNDTDSLWCLQKAEAITFTECGNTWVAYKSSLICTLVNSDGVTELEYFYIINLNILNMHL